MRNFERWGDWAFIALLGALIVIALWGTFAPTKDTANNRANNAPPAIIPFQPRFAPATPVLAPYPAPASLPPFLTTPVAPLSLPPNVTPDPPPRPRP